MNFRLEDLCSDSSSALSVCVTMSIFWLPVSSSAKKGLMVSTVLEAFTNNACKVLSTVPGAQQTHNKWCWTWLWGWRELFWSVVLLFSPEEVGRRQGECWVKLGAGEVDVLPEGLISEPLIYFWSCMSLALSHLWSLHYCPSSLI